PSSDLEYCISRNITIGSSKLSIISTHHLLQPFAKVSTSSLARLAKSCGESLTVLRPALQLMPVRRRRAPATTSAGRASQHCSKGAGIASTPPPPNRADPRLPRRDRDSTARLGTPGQSH